MDEKKLSELLKDVVAETPPPTFTASDVARESDRQRVRHRNGVLAGSAFGVAILAGATALGVALWTGPTSSPDATSAESLASGGNGNAAPYELPNEDNKAAAPTERGGAENVPSETPKQGGYPDGSGGPAGPAGTPRGCEQVDRELAAALAGELPAAARISPEAADLSQSECGQGVSAVTFHLADGTISAMSVPPDVLATMGQPPGRETERAQATTPSGRTVVVISTGSAPDAPPPYADRLQEWAAAIALKF